MLKTLTFWPYFLTCFWKVLKACSKVFKDFFIGDFKAYLYMTKDENWLFKMDSKVLKVFFIEFFMNFSLIPENPTNRWQVFDHFWKLLKPFEKVLKSFKGWSFNTTYLYKNHFKLIKMVFKKSFKFFKKLKKVKRFLFQNNRHLTFKKSK